MALRLAVSEHSLARCIRRISHVFGANGGRDNARDERLISMLTFPGGNFTYCARVVYFVRSLRRRHISLNPDKGYIKGGIPTLPFNTSYPLKLVRALGSSAPYRPLKLSTLDRELTMTVEYRIHSPGLIYPWRSELLQRYTINIAFHV